MYYCQIQFHLSGSPCRAFEIIKEISPYQNYSHKYIQSSILDLSLLPEADVIVANLQDSDAREAVKGILSAKRADAELILILQKEQVESISEYLHEMTDIWTLPLSDQEIQYRCSKWQKTYRMQKDFWETSQYLEVAINHVPNLVWYKDKNGIHEKVNDSFCQTVNKTRQQVEGRGHAYIWDVEQDDPACINSERKVMESRKTYVSEELVQTGEGMRTLMTYKSPLIDLDGSVMGTVGVAIDVTQERMYEQEIIRKNKSLEKIFTTIDCGVMRHTADGRHVLDINRAALKILGYQSQEEMEQDGFQLIANTVFPEDRDRLVESINQLEKEGDSVNIEYRVKHKDGEVLHVMGNIKLLREDGELLYQRFLLDCTQQKLLEKKREKRQTELMQALTVDFDVACFFNLKSDKGITLRNDGQDAGAFLADEYGYIYFKQSMAKYINEIVYVQDREKLKQFCTTQYLIRALGKKKEDHINYRVKIQDEILYYQLKAVRTGMWDKQHGVVIGLRHVDEEIRREMEQKNLLQNALMQANQANKAKSVFLSNMSHDIRTPMNAIVGFTNLAISHIENRELVEEYLNKIMTSGNHLLSLINDVLDMSRIESGKMHLDEKPCSLPDILHGLHNILQADIYAKQLELYMDAVDVLDEEIYCDRLRLNQVLLNLLSNAVKYTYTGGTIIMQLTEKPGALDGYANYEFVIQDTGIGMTKEFVARIFEPFEREKTSTISGVQGTGLGMAITKNIIDLMNGTIEIESEQGKGTKVTVCFTFRLHNEKKELKEIPELKNCRALVIDDDFNTCDSVTYMLGQIGMRAEWTLSGKEALLRTRQAVTREDIYHVYVIDWMLPDMNGIEVTRRIRKEMGDDVPIILLTAYDWTDIEDEAKEAGISAFCSKPLFMSELRSCLRSIAEVADIDQKEVEHAKEQRHTGRILLAEDNEINQEIAAAILQDAGFTIEIAGNGQIAIDMLEASKPGYYSVILMDIQMPVMNGYEATKAIRKLENKQLAKIPILAMTANAFEEDKQQALECGMNGHLAKPIEIDALLHMLEQVLAKSASPIGRYN